MLDGQSSGECQDHLSNSRYAGAGFWLGDAMTHLVLYWASFIVAVLSVGPTFHVAYQLPLVKEFNFVSHVYSAELALWALNPTALLMRTAGLLDPWHEQVLVYSILDICTNAVTLSVILLAHFQVIVTGADGALQVVGNFAHLSQCLMGRRQD